MKGYYLVYDTFDFDNPDGVEKKIIAQKNTFISCGVDMQFYILEKKNGSFWNAPEKISNVDFVYFRRGTVADCRFVRFLKRLKELNSRMVIFMEIPTFPYENEYDSSFRSKVILMIDHIFRKELYRYIDRLIIVNNHDREVWRIKTLNLINGVDLGSFRPKKVMKTDDVIRICCVAKFSPWHGYERIIRGLREYYDNNPKQIVKLIMVGVGIETGKYIRLANELKLDSHIEFKGQLTGKALEEVYDECDIGCCSLGRYKSNLEMTSELKSREIMGKGMPMICGCKIDVLEGVDYPYAMYFPNDDSDIDITKVLSLYRKMIQNKAPEVLRDEIRTFAEKTVEIRATFKPIVEEAIRLCGRE